MTDAKRDYREEGDEGGVMRDMKLEVVTIPVSDVDRAKDFYVRMGWRLDKTPPVVVQLTPPGSPCSVQFGPNRTSATPGSAENTYLVVSDIEATREELLAKDIEVGELFHLGPGGPVKGPDPEHRSYSQQAIVRDPDGNSWLLQEITTRLPGRVDTSATSFGSTADLAEALRRAEAAHAEHEKRTGETDKDWPAWYADYIRREQAGDELPT